MALGPPHRPASGFVSLKLPVPRLSQDQPRRLPNWTPASVLPASTVHGAVKETLSFRCVSGHVMPKRLHLSQSQGKHPQGPVPSSHLVPTQSHLTASFLFLGQAKLLPALHWSHRALRCPLDIQIHRGSPDTLRDGPWLIPWLLAISILKAIG